MATYETRNGKIRAIIRHKSLSKRLSKTFPTKKQAEAWAKEQEYKLGLGVYFDIAASKDIPFDSMLLRYRDEVTVNKVETSMDVEISRIRVIRAQVTGLSTKQIADKYEDTPLDSGLSLADIDERFISGYIKKRMTLDGVCWDTVHKELNTINMVLRVCEIAWGKKIHPDVIKRGIKLFDVVNKHIIRESVERDRRVSEIEYQLIESAKSKHALVAMFAMETAMRRGEIAALRVRDFNPSTRLLTIRKSKTDHKKRKKALGRTIPLTPKAVEILQTFTSGKKEQDLIFGCSDPKSLSRGWDRLAEKLGIEDLRFHDFRHEATSRFFEAGLRIEQVALITGHDTWSSLKRYTQLKPEMLTAHLDGMKNGAPRAPAVSAPPTELLEAI